MTSCARYSRKAGFVAIDTGFHLHTEMQLHRIAGPDIASSGSASDCLLMPRRADKYRLRQRVDRLVGSDRPAVSHGSTMLEGIAILGSNAHTEHTLRRQWNEV